MSDAGRVQVGHPVDVGSGAVFTMMEDFLLPGTLDLSWLRYYSTELKDTGWLGAGWTVPWFMRLARVPDGYELFDEQGRRLVFAVATGTELQVGGRILSPGANMELIRAADRWIIEHWHDGNDDIERFVFLPNGRACLPLAWIENLAGHRVIVECDPNDRPMRLTQEIEQRRVELAYSESGLLQAVSAVFDDGSARPLARYEYDVARRLVAAYDALDNRTAYAYDDAGRMVRETGALGSSFHFHYDGVGRCVHTHGDGGYLERRLRFSTAPPATFVTDGLGHLTQYFLNRAGQVIQQVSPLGAATTTDYDQHGRVLAVRDALGQTTQFEYDTRGNRQAVQFADGTRAETTCTDYHVLARYVDPTGAAWVYEHDARGLVIGLTTPVGHRYQAIRDARGLITETRFPTGNWVARRHGPRLSWVEAADGVSLLSRTEYDALGNQIAIYDAQGLVQAARYDALGRPVRLRDGAGRDFDLAWNALGELTALSGPGVVWERRVYDSFGQLVEHENPLGAMHMQYDVEGRITRIVNRAGESLRWTYDADGRMASETGFDGRIERFEYDLLGRPVLIHKADGRTVAQRYGVGGAIMERADSDGRTDLFVYDAAGRLVRADNSDAEVLLERDIEGRVTAETQNGQRIEYQHDADGDRSGRRIVGQVNGTLAFARDARKRLVALADAGGTCVELRWDEVGRLLERRFGDRATETLTYDPAGRPLEQRVRSPGLAVPIERHFEHDSNDNLIGRRDWRQGNAHYGLDTLGRLLQVDEPGHQERYVYDANGAIRETQRGPRVVAAGGAVLQDGSRAFRYADDGSVAEVTDAAGLKVSYEHNVEGQLTRAVLADGREARYAYDALGRRVGKVVDGVQTLFLWEGPTLAAEYREGGNVVDYYMFDYEPLLQWHGGRRVMPVRDQSGMVRELLDEDGRLAWEGRFDAYGALRGQSGPLDSAIRFPGQYFDAETGLHYNFHRNYDPLLGEYTARDPIGIDGGSHFYAYPRNPLMWDDPFGLKCSAGHSAETSMDGYFGAKGYKKIGAKGKPMSANGLDAVYYKRGGKPPYIIAEAKSGGARLGSDMHGNQQMSDAWINGRPGDRGRTRLDGAFPPGSPHPDRIDAAADKGNVGKVVYNPDKDPKVVQTGNYNGTGSTTSTF